MIIDTLLCIGNNSNGELLLLVFDMNDNLKYIRIVLKSRDQVKLITRFMSPNRHERFNNIINSNKSAIRIDLSKECWNWMRAGGINIYLTR